MNPQLVRISLLAVFVATTCAVAAPLENEPSSVLNPTATPALSTNTRDREFPRVVSSPKNGQRIFSNNDEVTLNHAKEVLAWLAIFGAFGGILATLSEVPIQRILAEGSRAYGTPGRLLWGMLVGSAWGVGGAVSFSIILVLDHHVSDSRFQMAETRILLAGIGVAAGFAGIRLLKLVGGRLERQVGEIVDKKTAAFESTTDAKLEQNTGAIALLTEALSNASGVLAIPDEERSADPRRREAIEKLEMARVAFPTLRSVAIYLGRLYKGLKDYRGGMEVLTEFLDARRKTGIQKNGDDAALLYNRACYTALAAENAADRDELYRQALDDLSQSLQLAPENAAVAAVDPDFDRLRKDRPAEMRQLA